MVRITHVNNALRAARMALSYARGIALAVVAVAAVLVAVPSQASAESLVPFHATVAETFTLGPCSPGPSLCVTTMGSGQATHLGQIHEAAAVVADLASPTGPGCFSETRTTTLTAANGDQLTLDATGHNCATGATTVAAEDAYVVTGGTGRFSGASGSGTITATVDLANGTAVVTFRGQLSSPGSLR